MIRNERLNYDGATGDSLSLCIAPYAARDCCTNIYLARFYDELDELDKESDEPITSESIDNDTSRTVRKSLEQETKQ
jgi:hypothetical protein